MARSGLAVTLAFLLAFGSSLEASTLPSSQTPAQTPGQKRKSKKPKSPACQTGCKPEIPAPEVSANSPEDEAAQKELADLARALHGTERDAYQKLSAFAVKNTTNVLGAREALALGYEDYSKNRTAQALGWLLKAQNDALLREYALYWTAQAQRALGRTAETYKNLQAIQRDYPNTAMREQLLETFAPTAVQLGHAQEAIDALNAYSATSTKSNLLLERGRAYQAAHQLPRAAKDYQTIFYKFPLTDEAKPAGVAMTQMMHALGKEYT